jgi:integrase/recombinase XerD
MTNSECKPRFQSPLALLMEQFVQTKQACGYRFDEGTRLLRRLDRHLSAAGLAGCELPKTLLRQWLARQPHESARTQQCRISLARQFAVYLCRLGYSAYVPERALSAKVNSGFCPRILTHSEVQQLLQAVDQLTPNARAPLRHLIMPEVFRLLYGCGFRVNEVLHLRVSDVDLDHGILTVREAKFGKDRLVPPALPLVERLQRYAAGFGSRSSDEYFFPSSQGGSLSHSAVYWLYRELLLRCGIAHGGRGKGPRVHDLRHTMAVHSLLRWYREGADLDTKLPVLATYLGHQSLAGTQRYLHLTAELFPQITVRANAAFGDVIPRRLAQ